MLKGVSLDEAVEGGKPVFDGGSSRDKVSPAALGALLGESKVDDAPRAPSTPSGLEPFIGATVPLARRMQCRHYTLLTFLYAISYLIDNLEGKDVQVCTKLFFCHLKEGMRDISHFSKEYKRIEADFNVFTSSLASELEKKFRQEICRCQQLAGSGHSEKRVIDGPLLDEIARFAPAVGISRPEDWAKVCYTITKATITQFLNFIQSSPTLQLYGGAYQLILFNSLGKKIEGLEGTQLIIACYDILHLISAASAHAKGVVKKDQNIAAMIHTVANYIDTVIKRYVLPSVDLPRLTLFTREVDFDAKASLRVVKNITKKDHPFVARQLLLLSCKGYPFEIQNLLAKQLGWASCYMTYLAHSPPLSPLLERFSCALLLHRTCRAYHTSLLTNPKAMPHSAASLVAAMEVSSSNRVVPGYCHALEGFYHPMGYFPHQQKYWAKKRGLPTAQLDLLSQGSGDKLKATTAIMVSKLVEQIDALPEDELSISEELFGSGYSRDELTEMTARGDWTDKRQARRPRELTTIMLPIIRARKALDIEGAGPMVDDLLYHLDLLFELNRAFSIAKETHIPALTDMILECLILIDYGALRLAILAKTKRVPSFRLSAWDMAVCLGDISRERLPIDKAFKRGLYTLEGSLLPPSEGSAESIRLEALNYAQSFMSIDKADAQDNMLLVLEPLRRSVLKELELQMGRIST